MAFGIVVTLHDIIPNFDLLDVL